MVSTPARPVSVSTLRSVLDDLGQALGRTGVGGVRHGGDGDVRAADLVEQARPGAQVGEALGPGQAVGTGAVEEHRADDVPASGGHGTAVGGLVVEVHVELGRAAAQEGLEGAERRAELDGLGVHDRRLGRPEVLEEALEVEVLGQTAQEGHRQVRVQVDEPRHQELAAGVDDDLVARRRGRVAYRPCRPR